MPLIQMSAPDHHSGVDSIFGGCAYNDSSIISVQEAHATQSRRTLLGSESPPRKSESSARESRGIDNENGENHPAESPYSTGGAPLHASSSAPLSECAPTPVISNRRPDFHALQRFPSEMNEMLSPPCLSEANGNYTPRASTLTLQTERCNKRNITAIECRFSSETDEPIVMTAASFHELITTHSDSNRHQSANMLSHTVARTMCMQGLSNESRAASVLIEMATWLSMNMAPLVYRTLRRTIVQNLTQQSATQSARKRTGYGQREWDFHSSYAPRIPLSTPSNSKSAVRGIRNYGQTCFLNSVLQALASLDSFSAYLQHVVGQNIERGEALQSFGWSQYDDTPQMFRKSVGSGAHSPLISSSLLEILHSVNGRDSVGTRTIDPRSVLRAVGRKHKQFQPSYGAVTNADQQDAQELLQAVLGMIVDEGQFETTPIVSTTPDGADEFTVTLASELIRMRMSKHEDIPCIDDHDMAREHHDNESNRNSTGLPRCESPRNFDSVVSTGLGEEKKQEEFEVYLPRESSEENLSGFNDALDMRERIIEDVGRDETASESMRQKPGIPTYPSKAMEIVMTTTSSISPCPLSGWCGSTLWCAACRRVRPMKNALFTDIPIVPTSVSQCMSFTSKLTGTHDPPCSLEECLKEYTRNEVVRDVECKNCTIQAEIAEQEFEETLRKQLIARLLSRRVRLASSKEPSSADDETMNRLQQELCVVRRRLRLLRQCSPDDDEPLGHVSNNDSFDEQEPEPIKIKRSDAVKCLILTRLPAVLSIHVQRRYYDQLSGRTSKTMQHVSFPEILDVSPFCAYGGELRQEAPFAGTVSKEKLKARAPINYKLMAIIEHLGGPNSGHYVSYRRDPSLDSQWLWISDDKVKSCDWSTVRRCQAYMLFYEAM